MRSLRSILSPCAHRSALSISADQTELSEFYDSYTTFSLLEEANEGIYKSSFVDQSGEDRERAQGFQPLLDIASSVAVTMQVHIAGILVCSVSGELLCFTCFPPSFSQRKQSDFKMYTIA